MQYYWHMRQARRVVLMQIRRLGRVSSRIRGGIQHCCHSCDFHAVLLASASASVWHCWCLTQMCLLRHYRLPQELAQQYQIGFRKRAQSVRKNPAFTHPTIRKLVYYYLSTTTTTRCLSPNNGPPPLLSTWPRPSSILAA